MTKSDLINDFLRDLITLTYIHDEKDLRDEIERYKEVYAWRLDYYKEKGE